MIVELFKFIIFLLIQWILCFFAKNLFEIDMKILHVLNKANAKY